MLATCFENSKSLRARVLTSRLLFTRYDGLYFLNEHGDLYIIIHLHLYRLKWGTLGQ